MIAQVPEDFVDFVRCLRAENCAFVIVGAHALAAHGAPRATGDLDVLVQADAENALRVVRALRRFGVPLDAHGVSEADFVVPGTVYQIGLPPRRIDILTEISGVPWARAAAEPVMARLGDELVPFIGIDAMIANKRATGRTKDLADAEVLEEIRARR